MKKTLAYSPFVFLVVRKSAVFIFFFNNVQYYLRKYWESIELHIQSPEFRIRYWLHKGARNRIAVCDSGKSLSKENRVKSFYGIRMCILRFAVTWEVHKTIPKLGMANLFLERHFALVRTSLSLPTLLMLSFYTLIGKNYMLQGFLLIYSTLSYDMHEVISMLVPVSAANCRTLPNLQSGTVPFAESLSFINRLLRILSMKLNSYLRRPQKMTIC